MSDPRDPDRKHDEIMNGDRDKPWDWRRKPKERPYTVKITITSGDIVAGLSMDVTESNRLRAIEAVLEMLEDYGSNHKRLE